MAVAGYNIAFRLDGATLAGRTQDDLTVAARTSERLTKDDQGSPQTSVIGQDITFRCTGLVVVTAENPSGMSRDAIIQMVLDSSAVAFSYVTSGGRTLSGNVVPVNYSESSNASDDATWTVDFRVVGTPTLSEAVEVNPGGTPTVDPGAGQSGSGDTGGTGTISDPSIQPGESAGGSGGGETGQIDNP